MEKSAFENHALWRTMKGAAEQITALDALGDAEVSAGLHEVRQLLAVSEAQREIDQLALLSPSSMDALNNAWSQLHQGVAQYVQAPASYLSHLETVKTATADAVRAALIQFPKPDEAGAKKGAATRAAGAYTEQVDAARRLLIEQLSELRADHLNEVAEHVRRGAELSAQLETAKAEAEKLAKRISDDETRLATSLTETSDAFLKAQADRQERFLKWLEQQEESFTDLAKPHLDAIIEADETAVRALEKVTQLRTSVVDMSNLASGDILGDQYKRSARWDRISGYVGYLTGILAGAAGVWVALFAFGDARGALEWPQVVLKLGLTAAVGGIAAVAFRFGGQALARATSFKRQELELRALTPFLQDVAGSDEAKLAFVKMAFGRAWGADQKAENVSESASNAELVKLLLMAIETLGKTSKA
ncbi:hypothetical protein [Microbacterium sp. NC79]|uniref:hypothetical protein n=1 Tax=Microbacterium sp. NC79 TaxID=2851009 RepID=UPI001C2C9CC7|nr:hypothetical protein [Microbacterium sp. NC79]MBV0894903.1 hypothetical protein [Microbacterium sp. NC79]